MPCEFVNIETVYLPFFSWCKIKEAKPVSMFCISWVGRHVTTPCCYSDSAAAQHTNGDSQPAPVCLGSNGRNNKKVWVVQMSGVIWRVISDSWPDTEMVWMKIAAVSAIGMYGYRSFTRVNQLVKQVKVPRHSLLDKYNSQVLLPNSLFYW